MTKLRLLISTARLSKPIFRVLNSTRRWAQSQGRITTFSGKRIFGGRFKVHSMVGNSRKSWLMWSFDPVGFLQMIYIDRGEFDKAHYKFDYSKREFLGEVRCIVFDVTPAPKARGVRFIVRIWVEDQDFTVVRINGIYAPAIHFSWKHVEDEYHLHISR